MNIAKIEKLIKAMEGSKTEELCVQRGECTVRVRKARRPAPAAPPPQPEAKPEPPARVEGPTQEPETRKAITAPMVGIFHTVDGIAHIGARIAKGDVIGTIESMKLLNDVVSDYDGVVREVEVEDGTPVEYGQPLCWIEVEQ